MGNNKDLKLKVGDLVWYNCAGSKQTGIVLEIFMKDDVFTYGEQTEMIKIHWNVNGSGPRPAMYAKDGTRLWGIEHLTAYVPTKSTSGIGIFKVISKA